MTAPKLHCLGGQGAPPELILGLERLLRLPPSAKQRFWDALGPALPEPLPPRAEPILDAFCAQHGVDKDDLAGALKACRFLLWEASRRSLGRDLFAQDLEALRPGDPELGRILLRGFEAAKEQIRRDLLARSLASHGKLLGDVEWRLDVVAASNQGLAFQAPVAMLTLWYEENGRRESITLQALPGAIKKLEATCKQLLAGNRDQGTGD